MARRLPHFVIIGAMKCATTTLHEQLARQPQFWMSHPKEPNFFSDDHLYQQGLAWYSSLFENAPDHAISGESSTHYTKLPAYPKTVERMRPALADTKFLYIIRHPIERLISHFWHDTLDGRITCPINEAISKHPNLIDFGRYAMQLRPFLDAFGSDRIQLIFFERLIADPQAELSRVCSFLGFDGDPIWDFDLKAQNVGAERMRQSRFREALINDPILGPIRRRLLPKSIAERFKGLWRVKQDQPELSVASLDRVREIYDRDLRTLGSWIDLPLTCKSFRSIARSRSPIWSHSRPQDSLRTEHSKA